MKAAIYARTSTEIQSTLSQIESCRNFVLAKGGQIVAVYDDQGGSTGSTDRDGLQTLLADSSSKRFNAVVVTRFDRLFRDSVELRRFMNEMARLRIEVIEVKA